MCDAITCKTTKILNCCKIKISLIEMVKKTKKSSKKENTGIVKSEKSGSLVHPIIFIIFVALKAALLFKIYINATYVPETPKMDLDFWWGPNNTKSNQDTSIRPFRILFSEAMQYDLSKRFEYFRYKTIPQSMDDVAFTYGFNSKALEKVYDHWCFKYKMADRERLLNKFKHFKTNIQGLDIHYVHVKPQVKENIRVIPLLLLHGWPSSFREFYEIIPLLTKENSKHGFIFELVIPSLPGFAYSQGSVRPGLGPAQAAVILRNLMQRIGLKKYHVHGGDLGHVIASHMITLFPKEILGFHTNFLVNFDKFSLLTWVLGSIYPKLIVDKDLESQMYPLKEKINFFIEESGYLHLQMTKPDTIGVALQESLMGLAAYILEKFSTFTNPLNKLREDGGLPEKGSLDNLLDNVMLYWMTDSITTSIRMFKETVKNNELERTLNRIPTSVPTWGLRPNHEVFYQPDFMVKWKYTNTLGTTNLEDGGHFIAYEEPKLLADDLFKAVDVFEKFHLNNVEK